MDIKGITGADAITKGSLNTSKKYVEKVTTAEQNKNQLEKIRDDVKGNSIDTRA